MTRDFPFGLFFCRWGNQDSIHNVNDSIRSRYRRNDVRIVVKSNLSVLNAQRYVVTIHHAEDLSVLKTFRFLCGQAYMILQDMLPATKMAAHILVKLDIM